MAAYDHSLQGTHIRDIYGVLEEGSAVCVGYAYAFDYILEQAPNAPACITRESADRAHAWNEVLFTNGDGKSYLYIDPTWDDRTSPTPTETPMFFTTISAFRPMSWRAWMTAIRSAAPAKGKTPRRSITICGRMLMTAYDEREAVRIFNRQYRSGGNMLTIRFQNPEDYERAQQWTGGRLCGIEPASWRCGV